MMQLKLEVCQMKDNTQVTTDGPFDWNKVAKEFCACHTFEEVVCVCLLENTFSLRLG